MKVEIWKEIIKVDEAIWYFAIFILNDQAIVIPKSFLRCKPN